MHLKYLIMDFETTAVILVLLFIFSFILMIHFMRLFLFCSVDSNFFCETKLCSDLSNPNQDVSDRTKNCGTHTTQQENPCECVNVFNFEATKIPENGNVGSIAHCTTVDHTNPTTRDLCDPELAHICIDHLALETL